MIGIPIKFSEPADSTTFCCEIQLARLHSKSRTQPNTCRWPDQEPALICKEASGKMCIDTILPDTFHLTLAQTCFLLGRFSAHLLKYNGCQKSHCCNAETQLYITAALLIYHSKSKLQEEKNNISVFLKFILLCGKQL